MKGAKCTFEQCYDSFLTLFVILTQVFASPVLYFALFSIYFLFFFRVMESGDEKVMTINLHKIVTRECGPIPFNNCYMMKKPHDVVSILSMKGEVISIVFSLVVFCFCDIEF